MKYIIQITKLEKSYGNTKAVRNVSFVVVKGEMFGLIGPDGAGKTTTIRILCGLLPADSGEVFLMGKNIVSNKNEVQNHIGYLSQKFSIYGDLTIDENIEFFADIHNVKNFKKRREELLEFTRLKPFRDRLTDKLSGGMKQKLALACSLIHKPEILFLDEPTTGVDPVSRRDFWKILSALRKDGITIIMTTPYLDEAERCSRVALMNKGEIIAVDTPQNIKNSINKVVVEIVCSPIRKAYQEITANTEFDAQIFGDRINIVLDNFDEQFPGIKTKLEQTGVVVTDYRSITPSLENVFMYLIKESG